MQLTEQKNTYSTNRKNKYSTKSLCTMPRLKNLKLLLWWGVALIGAGVLLALALRYVPASAEVYKSEGAINARDAPVLEWQIRPHLRRPVSELQKYLLPTTEKRQEPAHAATEKPNVQGHPRDYQVTSEIQCFAQKREIPWFKMKKYPETYLVFYGKPIMEDLRIISSNRGWKMKHIPKDSPEGIRELQELVSPETFIIVLTVSRVYSRKLIRDLANSTNALVGTVGNASKVTGAKRVQLTVFRDYFRTFGCSLEDTDIMPRSFILDDPTECIHFFRYSSTRPQSWWVLKPSAGQGGDGITIHSNLTYFYKKYATCMKQPDAIVQEYITNLLLVKNRKFDIRVYIFLAKTSPHFLVFYHEGYLRVSMKEFDIHGSREVHLTNSHVQASLEGFISDDHIWSFQDLQKYLDTHRPNGGRGFVSNTLVPVIQKLGLVISHTAKSVFSRDPSNFLLIGLDFMVTSDLSVKFIEANNYPLWPRGSAFINDMMEKMGNDMFDLLFDCRHYPDQFQDMKPGQVYGTWTLIWNELHAECSNSPPFNPCMEFMEQ